MKILVTGGAGFIGSNFIRYILTRHTGYKVVNLDKLTYSRNPDNLKDFISNTNYKFIKGDICNEKVVEKYIKGCDCVLNFASETHVDKSILNPSIFFKTNILGTHTLLEAAYKNKIKKFIQISTDEVYGSIDRGAHRESDALNPANPYSSSKAGADLLTLSYYKTYGMNICITRSTNNFGPYQYPEKLISFFITNAIEGKELPLYGDGLNIRNWLYVEDNCGGIDIVLHKGKVGEIYNIASDCEKTNLEVAHLILRFLNKNKSLIKFLNDRPGHDRRYAIDCSKLKTLGWEPKFEFEEAMKKTVKWYIENSSWWDKIKKSSRYERYYRRWYGERKF